MKFIKGANIEMPFNMTEENSGMTARCGATKGVVQNLHGVYYEVLYVR